MTRLAGWLLMAWLAAVVPPAPQAAPERPIFKYFTQLGDHVLNRVDAVLFGTVAGVTRMRGTDVVRVTIGTWYFGERADGAADVTLLANPGDFFVGSEQLLFLKLYSGGPRFTLHNRIARSDPDFDAKRRVLEQDLALRAFEREEDRRREVRKHLYDDAGARDAWTRWHAYHELEYVRSAYEGLVTREDREDLVRLAARCEDERFKKALLNLLKEWTT